MNDPGHDEPCDVEAVDKATLDSRASADSAVRAAVGKGKTQRFSSAFWNVVVKSCVPVLVLLVGWLLR